MQYFSADPAMSKLMVKMITVAMQRIRKQRDRPPPLSCCVADI